MSTNRDVFDAWFAALETVDVDGIVAPFAPDGEYQDMPRESVPTVGTEALRAKVANFTRIARFECTFSLIVEVGDRIFSERIECQILPTGESADLPVMSVMEFRDGMISSLREYWDLDTVRKQFEAQRGAST